MSGEQFLPRVVTRDADGTVTGLEPALECTDLAHTSVPAGGGVLTVRSVDPSADGDPVVDVAAVAADGDLVYASTDRLYVATFTPGGSYGGGATTRVWSWDGATWIQLGADMPATADPVIAAGHCRLHLALEDEGGALSAWEVDQRRGALTPLARAGRRALTAACSPEVWPPE